MYKEADDSQREMWPFENGQKDTTSVAFKMEKEGQEPRNVGGLQKLENARKYSTL